MNLLSKTLVLLSVAMMFSCSSTRTGCMPDNLQRKWMLKSLPGFTLEQLVQNKVVIDLSNKQHPAGYAGCNNIFFKVTKQSGNKISFTDMGSTKMYCAEKMAIEDVYIQTLGVISAYQLDGHKLILKDVNGKVLIEAIAEDWD